MIPYLDNPDDWNPVFSLVTVSPERDVSCGLNVVTLVEGVDTIVFTNEQLKQLQSLDKYRAVREGVSLTRNGVNWRVCDYTWVEDGTEYHQLQCFTVIGSQGYIFFASAPQEKWEGNKVRFTEVFRSIDFENPVLVLPQ